MATLPIGYKVINRRRIVGASVLNKIKYGKLRAVGAGASGLVMTDGKYAIKVGYVYDHDYDALMAAAEHGFAVPVVYFERKIKLDPRIVKFIRNTTFYRDGYPVDVDEFVDALDMADMMISMLAQPFFDNTCEVQTDDRRAGYELVNEVSREYAEKTGDSWGDPHPWNLGIYRGALIILDF